ncbi:hypothetical protein NQZ68_025135 [Dissostichus eleginoides]|nr:hypothetical protein NQZ68_025135 [Dissostichus eleginoides]
MEEQHNFQAPIQPPGFICLPRYHHDEKDSRERSSPVRQLSSLNKFNSGQCMNYTANDADSISAKLMLASIWRP